MQSLLRRYWQPGAIAGASLTLVRATLLPALFRTPNKELTWESKLHHFENQSSIPLESSDLLTQQAERSPCWAKHSPRQWGPECTDSSLLNSLSSFELPPELFKEMWVCMFGGCAGWRAYVSPRFFAPCWLLQLLVSSKHRHSFLCIISPHPPRGLCTDCTKRGLQEKWRELQPEQMPLFPPGSGHPSHNPGGVPDSASWPNPSQMISLDCSFPVSSH